MGVLARSALPHLRADIEDEIGPGALRISIAVECHTLGGSKFRLHAVVIENHAVIPRLGNLVGLQNSEHHHPVSRQKIQ